MHARACETSAGQPGHLSFTGCGVVVPTQEVEEAMDCEESGFRLRAVPERFRLTPDSGPRQRQVAEVGARRIPAGQISARKGENVGHLVFAQELAVQPPQLAIACDSHCYLGRVASRPQRRRNLGLGRRRHEHATQEGSCDGCSDRLHNHHMKTDN